MSDIAPPGQTGVKPSPPVRPANDALRGALLDSRQRWRELVTLAADLAFETDEWGRFAFVIPDCALGWPASTLVGQPAELLLANGNDGGGGFNPFRTSTTVQRCIAWLKRADGAIACLSFAVSPLRDAEGRIVGVRGLGIDVTEQDGHEAQVAAALRRGEVLEHILWRMGREVLASGMMRGALDGLVKALGGEGAAVIAVPADRPGPEMTHQSGGGGEAVLPVAASLLDRRWPGPDQVTADDGRHVLVAACQTRFGERAGVAVWRTGGARAWDHEERLLAASAANLIRFALEHEALQREMALQARTDPLTGLLNRRAFLEEIVRHAERLDREELPGTLLFADLDNFKSVNDRLGHDIGDQVLQCTAALLRKVVRPSDLVARLGGDEFAVWLNGADQLTAAERAEQLRTQAPPELGEIVAHAVPQLGFSIGIATRRACSLESIDSVMRRADMAMYEVKREGRGHWRVAPEDCEPHEP